MHPLLSIPVYVAIILTFYLVLAHITRFFLGRLDDLPTLYRRLPYVLIFFTMYSVVGVLTMRIVHFIGLENLFHLMVGTSPPGAREENSALSRHQRIDRIG